MTCRTFDFAVSPEIVSLPASTLHCRIESGIPGKRFRSTGFEALVMDERRGRYGCKDSLHRMKELLPMGVRPQFDAISRKYGGKLRYNGGKLRHNDVISSAFTRTNGFFHL